MPVATARTAVIATTELVVTRCCTPAITPLEIPATLVINHAVVSVFMRARAAPSVPRRARDNTAPAATSDARRADPAHASVDRGERPAYGSSQTSGQNAEPTANPTLTWPTRASSAAPPAVRKK